jgi:1,4-alpha-glucan branching enzyme
MLEQLVHGRHGDPFSVLGCHPAQAGHFLVRTFLPGAVAVHLLRSRAKPLPMPRVHSDGVFEVKVKAKLAPRYRLQVQWADGHEEELEDAYRFGPLLSNDTLWWLAEGTHLRPYEALGALLCQVDGVSGTRFAVWAPNASQVSVVSSFNYWDRRRHPMRLRREAGVWELFVPGVSAGALYKFSLLDANGQELAARSDPYARQAELRPATASIVAPLPAFVPALASRAQANSIHAPICIYEVHLGSWRHILDPQTGQARWMSWDELASTLVSYASSMGFTHLELMPVSEYPFDGSWGYQPIGLYAPTARFGDAAGFARFIQACHDAGLGVLLDWVPAHFPSDAHGLANFDGSHLYEYADPREGFHNDWNTLIYNYGRNEVRNFLLGNALYWLERFGVDGLRVDAVSSMLYRDYSRAPGEWIPNAHGRENLESIAFFKRMNEVLGRERPEAATIAEESTAFPAVSRPTNAGGLGFHYKWNMGWMHDSLQYIEREPIHRQHHQSELSFGLVYAFDEQFILPISHDEVVHGKGSLLTKMPGDRWQKFANLRAYLGFMYAHPGKKLLFMGCEFAQEREWNHDASLDWHLLEKEEHKGVQSLVRDLNMLYRRETALHELDASAAGFEWIDFSDAQHSVLSFLRKSKAANEIVLVVCNFTPTVHRGYRIGVPNPGVYREVLNTDSAFYGGGNIGLADGAASTESKHWQGRPWSICVNLAPLATIVFKWQSGT